MTSLLSDGRDVKAFHSVSSDIALGGLDGLDETHCP
jgi:hypothetical protein